MRLPAPLLLISDRRAATRPLTEVIELALQAGCRWLLLREPDLEDCELQCLVETIAALAQPYGANLSVARSAQVAAACRAGLHLPRGGCVADARKALGWQACIGLSTHSRAEAIEALHAGADYITLSPIFLSQSKPGYGPALGLDELSTLARALPIPVVALGGVTPTRAAQCLRAGAASVAVMGAVMRASNPWQTTRDILERIDLTTEAQRHRGF